LRDHEVGMVIEEDEAPLQSVLNFAAHERRGVYLDGTTGQPLDPALVVAARAKELEYFNPKQVWTKRRISEAAAKTGKAPISVRWIDTNKGDDEHPNYRSRLVAREIRRRGEDPIFAPTPPLESLRTVLSLAATDVPGAARHVRDGASEHRTQVSFIDIARAYFCAQTDPDQPTYVSLPAEDGDHGAMCGLLLKHMYGTRKAADGWHSEYASRLVDDLGFEIGDASACVFLHKARNLRCSVHGDDLTTCGPKMHLDWFKSELEKFYELTEAHRLGPGPSDDKEARVLNRIVRWTDAGLEYEADPRQTEKLLRDLKLGEADTKALGTPGVKSTKEQFDADQPLAPDKSSPFRAVSARSNYLAMDRPDMQFAAKEVCRWMAHPTELSLSALKRIGRYLSGRRRLVFGYPWQEADRIDIYSDTDWAGCAKTRKSTSGGCAMLGRHLIKSWATTQTSVSLSSGESEFYGVVKAAGVGLGYQALLRDLGLAVPVRVWTDSTATIGICGRQGLGRLRHVDTQCLWIQQRVRDGTVQLYKVRGEVNPADLFTKHLTGADRVRDLLQLFGCSYQDGRPASAPMLRQAAGKQLGEMLASVDSTDTMMHYGRRFPKSEYEGDAIPEAYRHDPLLLPHLHEDLEQLFPCAVACSPAGDADPLEDTSLEKRGIRIGHGFSNEHGEGR
jgi:hypothetical protein